MRTLRWLPIVLATMIPCTAMAQGLGPDEDGVVPLFNGRDLSGWHALNHWLVEDGVLHCTGERDGSGWLRSELMYEDFVLRLEYKISPRGNSGIFVRAPVVGRCSQIGMEIQIRDDRGRDPSSSSAGALYKIMAPARSVSKPAMEWNDIEISCRGKRVVTTMNGEQLYHVDLDDDELNARLADDFKASGRRRFGHIGLQNHGKPVWFRNIRIKPLPPQGYIPLFNGRDLGGWREVGHGSWSVENGLLVFEGKAAGRLLSEQMHGDFRLKLDYRLTEGAGGGVCVGGSDTDGGVEVQLLDDAGAEPSPTSSGALHGILAPAKNATRPTGGWNQLEVTRRDGVLSANLNIVDLWSAGLAEHDKLRALPARCAIGLQGSGGRIEFRNIYLKPLAPGVW